MTGAQSHVDPRLEITLPDGEVLEVAVLPGDVTIGRTSSNSVVLRDESASGMHAVLRSNGQAFSIVDMGSRNGVFVNGERIVESRLLADGDQIRIGITEMRFSLAHTSKSAAVVEEDEVDDEPEPREHRLSPRMRAARIDFVGRIIAQMLTVLAALAISMYLFGSMSSGCSPGGQ